MFIKENIFFTILCLDRIKNITFIGLAQLSLCLPDTEKLFGLWPPTLNYCYIGQERRIEYLTIKPYLTLSQIHWFYLHISFICAVFYINNLGPKIQFKTLAIHLKSLGQDISNFEYSWSIFSKKVRAGRCYSQIIYNSQNWFRYKG